MALIFISISYRAGGDFAGAFEKLNDNDYENERASNNPDNNSSSGIAGYIHSCYSF